MTALPTVTTTVPAAVGITTAIAGGNVTSDGGAAVTARGVCWSTTANPTVADARTSDGTGTGAFTGTLSGLSAGTTYYVRAYATNSAGTRYGELRPFTTACTVTFDAAGGTVTPASKSVIFNTPYGTLPMPTRTDYVFAGWRTGDNGTGIQVTEATIVPTAANHVIHAKWMLNQTILFPALPAKTYGDADFAPGATASSGLAVTYTSSNAAVATIVDGKIHIVGAGTTSITAAQTGDDSWNAALPVTQSLTVAQKTLTATAENKTRSFGAANPAFSIAYTGLANGDTAAVLDTPPMAVCSATATSGVGTYPITVSGGSDTNYALSCVAGTLTIMTALPTVTTTVPAAIGTTTATSGGMVTSDGGAAVTARGVCWSTTATPTVADARTADGAGTGAFTSTLTKLSPGTTYYVRPYATNSAGTGYGEPCSFTTPGAAGADFVVTGIVLTPALPAVGGKLTATITVKNQGILSGKGGYLYVWLDKPAPAAVGEKSDKSTSISTLRPGASKAVKMSLTAPKTRGSFTLRAFADAKNGAKEDDEYNNQAAYEYNTGLPDFRIKTVTISPEIPTAARTFTAYVTVTNWGEVAGDAGYLDLWADSSILAAPPVPGRTTKGNKYKMVGTLQVGQEKTITVTGLKAPTTNAAPILYLLLDSRAKTLEMDEDNNGFELDYECQ
ncbi:MAG: MBG domain-containing protein [Lentisphaeria bacterium]